MSPRAERGAEDGAGDAIEAAGLAGGGATSTTSPAASQTRAVVEGFAVSAMIALVWFGLAALNPTTTYHFAPLLAAVAASAFARFRRGSALSIGAAAVSIFAGGTVAGVAAVGIATLGWMTGPTFFAGVSAPQEAIAAIVIGCGLGAAVALAPWRWWSARQSL